MNALNNSDYYRRRAKEAAARAGSATLPEVRRVHAEMAERYARLQLEAEREARKPAVRSMLEIVHPG